MGELGDRHATSDMGCWWHATGARGGARSRAHSLMARPRERTRQVQALRRGTAQRLRTRAALRTALLRAAAKNYEHVTVVVDPDDYEDVLAELYRYRATKEKTRRALAGKAFAHTAAYDSFVTSYFYQGVDDQFPPAFSVSLHKIQDLRYGENLHQRAALYSDTPVSRDLRPPRSVATVEQLHGKELSFTAEVDIRPPLLTERALVLCSGFPPLFDVVYGRPRLTYCDVPEEVAGLAAEVLRHDLL